MKAIKSLEIQFKLLLRNKLSNFYIQYQDSSQISNDRYIEIVKDRSAAESLIESWFITQITKNCLLELPTTFMVDGIHRTPRELAIKLIGEGEIRYVEKDGAERTVDTKHVLDLIELIKKDPLFLKNHPLTIRDIEDSAKQIHDHLIDQQYLIEDGLHRSIAIAYLIFKGDFVKTFVHIIYGKVKRELISITYSNLRKN